MLRRMQRINGERVSEAALDDVPRGGAQLVTTRSSRITSADEAAATLLGRGVGALVQKPLAALVDLDDRSLFRSRIALLSPDERIDDWRLHLRRPDGIRVAVVATVTVAGDSGTTGDETLRWRLRPDAETEAEAEAEAEAKRSLSTYRHAQSQVEHTLNELAHELNQPLAAIITFVRGTQLRLQNGELSDADLRTALSTIADEALRATEIVQELRRKWSAS